ncbi:MAG: 16S rRNA (cytosine(1402)-N(4))-methyltransferase RsmH [Actinobacteria bacterium]|nr:16S rRNA (cytosine(1402)-N(4))-methyltransferase RsmH [Actinomycetota bacterium]
MSQAPYEHRPVMLAAVVGALEPAPAGTVLDATVGGGGHARAVLEAYPHLRLLGLDRDEDALVAAAATLAVFGERAVLRRARFDQLGEVLEDQGVEQLSAAVFDLGVSSPQFDRPDRGFSYRSEAPLDMRMDRREVRTAAHIVNTYDEKALARLFAQNGEERFARRIARAVVAARPITTTGQLVEVVRAAIPAPARRSGGHPAKRVFQALRIEVNSELDVLPVALDAAIARLAPGGRLVVIAYHSGEDRIVKECFLAAESGGCTCPPGLPCGCGSRPVARRVHRGARKPRPEELAMNPRAQSARLRVLEKLS